MVPVGPPEQRRARLPGGPRAHEIGPLSMVHHPHGPHAAQLGAGRHDPALTRLNARARVDAGVSNGKKRNAIGVLLAPIARSQQTPSAPDEVVRLFTSDLRRPRYLPARREGYLGQIRSVHHVDTRPGAAVSVSASPH
jgi:hypothetical protein